MWVRMMRLSSGFLTGALSLSTLLLLSAAGGPFCCCHQSLFMCKNPINPGYIQPIDLFLKLFFRFAFIFQSSGTARTPRPRLLLPGFFLPSWGVLLPFRVYHNSPWYSGWMRHIQK